MEELKVMDTDTIYARGKYDAYSEIEDLLDGLDHSLERVSTGDEARDEFDSFIADFTYAKKKAWAKLARV